ncbi:MAG: hypothetical protein Ct9H90mP25_2800 [Gammaproteobacteria bacterium]|nr:MAG: hypothetical protein Ct9H90mP25_2800 [Gammaproteobacteria bacterium]
MEKYAGSCHCKAVVFEVQAREDAEMKSVIVQSAVCQAIYI